jgi:hypothetical protein
MAGPQECVKNGKAMVGVAMVVGMRSPRLNRIYFNEPPLSDWLIISIANLKEPGYFELL